MYLLYTTIAEVVGSATTAAAAAAAVLSIHSRGDGLGGSWALAPPACLVRSAGSSGWPAKACLPPCCLGVLLSSCPAGLLVVRVALCEPVLRCWLFVFVLLVAWPDFLVPWLLVPATWPVVDHAPGATWPQVVAAPAGAPPLAPRCRPFYSSSLEPFRYSRAPPAVRPGGAPPFAAGLSV